MNDDYEAEINLVARCTCGYVFDHLIYLSEKKVVKNGYNATLYVLPEVIFSPSICPNCHKAIKSINSKYVRDKSDNIEMDFGYNGYKN